MAELYDSQKRRSVNLKLSERAEGFVREVKEHTGVTQLAFIERLIEWFVVQDPKVQMALMHAKGDPAAELVRLRLGEIAGAKAGDPAALGSMSVHELLALLAKITELLIESERGRIRTGEIVRKAADPSKKKG